MRIGILTQPQRANYGGIIQNWALQQVLRRLGHNPVTISYGYFTRHTRRRINIYWLAHNLLRTKARHSLESTWAWRRGECARLQNFCRRHLALTRGNDCCSERHWHADRVDAYVVGSDQVWRPCYNAGSGMLRAMLGGYVPDGKLLVAYAASFGSDEWEMTSEQTTMARNLIRNFAAVSVREHSGVELCRRYLGVDAQHVLDPTLLLTAADYRSLITPEAAASIPDRALGVYILDPTPAKQAETERLAAQLNLQIHLMGQHDAKGHKASMESWLAAFDRAEYILTDSFHGTVFSLLFHRPFTTLINEQRGAGRVTSLLALAGLPDRTDPAAATAPIDWRAVDSRLAASRPASIDFLRTTLSA